MSILLEKLIRVANDYPETREYLVPLLKQGFHASVDILAFFKGAKIDSLELGTWNLSTSDRLAFILDIQRMHGVYTPTVEKLPVKLQGKYDLVVKDAGEIISVILAAGVIKSYLQKLEKKAGGKLVQIEKAEMKFNMTQSRPVEAGDIEEQLEPNGFANLKGMAIFDNGEKLPVKHTRLPVMIVMDPSPEYGDQIVDFLESQEFPM